MKARLFVVVTAAMLVACSSQGQKGTTGTQSAPPQFSTLEQLLAPIALYPDQLLAQILMCAGVPSKVAELDTWLQSHQQLTGTELQDAAVKAGFEPSFVALALFPSVISKMAAQIGWTAQVGQAFAADRSAVFTTIQKLRRQAQDVGTLKDTPQQDISTKTTSAGQQVIVIEPANPQVIYVPQYNPQTVYTTAATTTTTTVVVKEESSNDAAVAAGLIGFTAGIVIGASMNNSYYYGPYGWHGGAYMYNEAWDDYYDAREDAREDWMDHREDMMENRSDRAENAREQRTERAETRQDTRGTTQQQRTERQQNRQENRPATQRSTPSASAQSASPRSSARTGSAEARGYGDRSATQSTTARSTARTGSADAFSGYSSGSSQRASSNRGQQSRSSSRSSGGGGRRR